MKQAPKDSQKRSVFRTINNGPLKQILVWNKEPGAGSISADDQGLLPMNGLSFNLLVWTCWCRWQHLTPIQRGSQSSVTTDIRGWSVTHCSLTDEIPLHGAFDLDGKHGMTRGKTLQVTMGTGAKQPPALPCWVCAAQMKPGLKCWYSLGYLTLGL